MFKFALKNMAIKKVQMILIVLSVVVSASVAILAFNIASQVSDGITSTAGYYSLIIGPAGSSTQLAMNTMYFTDSVLGTIPYSLVEELQQNTAQVRTVIPYAMADNYNGRSVVGTTTDYLSGKTLKDGRLFDDTAVREVVVGARVAEERHLSVGSTIITGHSATELHEDSPLTVVGILDTTHSVYDNMVFTQIKTLWELHEHEEGEGGGEHDHEEGQSVCAILVKTKNPTAAILLKEKYNNSIYEVDDGDGDTLQYSLQAIEPMETVRGILDETDSTKQIVYVLCGIILAMNILVISIITILNMYNSAKEIALMRLIGIGMNKINLLYIIQNGIVGLFSTVLAFGVSRLSMLLVQNYVASMGVVLNFGKVYPLEFVIMAVVFIISVLPTVICTFSMSKKDSIEG